MAVTREVFDARPWAEHRENEPDGIYADLGAFQTWFNSRCHHSRIADADEFCDAIDPTQLYAVFCDVFDELATNGGRSLCNSPASSGRHFPVTP